MIMLGGIVIGYAAISLVIYSDWKKVNKKYKIKRNGFKFVVRDNKGKFVKLPKSNISGFFTVISLD